MLELQSHYTSIDNVDATYFSHIIGHGVTLKKSWLSVNNQNLQSATTTHYGTIQNRYLQRYPTVI